MARADIVANITRATLAAGVLWRFGSEIQAFLAPPAISPIFQDGGTLSSFNEDFFLVTAMLVVLGIADVASRALGIVEKGRWFFVHAIANAVSAVAAAPDVYRALYGDPTHCFSGRTHTMVANSAVAAAHIYHVLAFKLRAEDIFHHLVFTVILCGLAIPYKHAGGVANNFGCFFLSGLPGGVDYVLLVLVKQGAMAPITEKRLNAAINTWVRGPSMAVYAMLGWQACIACAYRIGHGHV